MTPITLLSGSATVGVAPTLLVPYLDLASTRAEGFALWVVNRSLKPISVLIEGGPDGSHADQDTLAPYEGVAPGSACYLTLAGDLRRFWSISAYCPTWVAGDTIAVAYGITIRPGRW